MPSLFSGYRASWLRGDLVAGVTVAAIAIPEGLGYANIAGLPVEAGLYCALLPAVVFALVASSRQLVVGADSATASLVAVGAGTVAVAGTAEYSGAVAVLGLITAALLAIMAVARLGFLADLISQPVLVGFLSGVGLSLVIGKLPAMLGIEASGTTWDKLVATVQGLADVVPAAALLSLGVVVIMLGTERFMPRLPAALLALAVMSLVGVLVGAEDRGVSVVGAIPAGLPAISVPEISSGEVPRLAATGASIAIVVLAQSAAVARSFAVKNQYAVSENTDLLALGGANAASALTGGFAINGSPPRTAAGDAAGSRTQVVNLVMAAVVAAVLLFATGLFDYIPLPVLDAVVFTIGIRLIDVRGLRRIARISRSETATALLALVVVAFVGVEQGVLVAVLVSLVDRFRRQYHPHDDVLLRDGKLAGRLASRAPHALDRLADVLVYRFGDDLFFANSDYFTRRVRTLIEGTAVPVGMVVLDCAAMGDIDVTGALALRGLSAELQGKQTAIVLTELAPGPLRTVTDSGVLEEAAYCPRLEEALRQAAAR